MSQMIYGVFNTRAQAESAILAVQIETRSVGVHALVHEGQLREQDVQMEATDAFHGAIVGALVVGGLAALIGAVLIPSGTLRFGWIEFALMTVVGTTLGVIAGAVAGSSEPRRKLLALAERLREGKILVTMKSDDELPLSTIVELFNENGAVEVVAA